MTTGRMRPLDPARLFAPGAEVFVILNYDPFRERIDVRTSHVLDREGEVLFLGQTDPPIAESLRGTEIEIAALPPEDEHPRRPAGYAARLLDIRPDFPAPAEALAEEARPAVPALAVSAPRAGDLFETSLRMHYRVPVEPGMNVVLRVGGGFRVTLLDFSAGGARAKLSPPEPPAPDQPSPDRQNPDRLGLEDEDPTADRLRQQAAGPADPAALRVGDSLPFRLLFLGSGTAEGDAVIRSLRPDEDGVSVIVGLCFTHMEIRDVRYLERMVARTVTTSRQRDRDADYE